MILGLIGPLGTWEVLLILLLLVLLFGARRIPELARSLGEGIRQFRASMRGEDESGKESRDRDAGGSERH